MYICYNRLYDTIIIGFTIYFMDKRKNERLTEIFNSISVGTRNWCKAILDKVSKLNVKIITEQSFELCVLIILTLFVVAYANYEFEIPFFPRGIEESVVEIELPWLSETDDSSQTSTEVEIENVTNVIDPSVFVTSANSTYDEQTGEYYYSAGFEHLDELTELGFTLSDTIFNADADYEYRFAKVTLEHTPLNRHGAVLPVMDYILVRDRNNQVILHDASGRIIDADFAASGLEILHMRDREGRTMFRRETTVYNANEDGSFEAVTTRTHYFFSPTSRQFHSVWFMDEMGERGVDFMYPSDFGVSDNHWSIFRHSDGRWGYQSTEHHWRTVAAEFNRAFNFREGFGIAYREIRGWQGHNLLFIGNRLYFHNEDGQVVNREFFGPDPFVPNESGATPPNLMGFFYFDHGLTRVIHKRLSAWENIVLEQREMLINTDFREFLLPMDYTVVAYSSGMILLEKDGRFGFMSYLGEWVAQPIYTYARPFFEGVAVLGTQTANGMRYMLIDRQGNIIAPMQYVHISNCTGGIIAMLDPNVGWTVLNKVRRPITTE